VYMTRALRGAFGGNGVYLGELGAHEWQSRVRTCCCTG
jgi:hypothetical protein